MAPLSIRDQVQASTGIAVEVGENWINGGYMAIRFTAGTGVPISAATVDMTNPKNAWLANTPPPGGISDGVLGFLGVQPQQYDQARSLIAAGVPSLNNADRLSGIDSTTAANRQTASNAGVTYLNGDALVPGGAGVQNQNTPTFSPGGMGGIQSDPRNEALWAQAAAQVASQRPATPAAGGLPNNMPQVGQGPASQGGGLGGSSGGASGGGLVQDVNVNQYQPNPYLAQMGTVLTNRVTDNLNRNIMPGIRSNAVMAGGFGGSRQGVIEANAMKDANQTISDALTGAYFQDFTNQMNRNLAQYGQNQNFYSNQRGQDLQQTQLGANLFNMGNQGFLSQGQGIYGLGSQQQQAPWQVVNNGNAGFGQWSGYGTTTSANTGGGAQGVLGGALAGGQYGKLWGNNSGSSQLGQMSNQDIQNSWYLG